MAVVLPVILIGAPVGYFTWASVFDKVDSQMARLCSASTKIPNSWPAATLGATLSLGTLSKAMFGPATRQRLFFSSEPPNTNMRIAALKLGLELFFRGGTIFYGAAAGGAMAGRLSVCRHQES